MKEGQSERDVVSASTHSEKKNGGLKTVRRSKSQKPSGKQRDAEGIDGLKMKIQ